MKQYFLEIFSYQHTGFPQSFIFFSCSKYSIVCLYHSLFIQCPCGGLLSYLQSFAVSILLRISWYIYYFSCVETYAKYRFPEGIDELKGKCICQGSNIKPTLLYECKMLWKVDEVTSKAFPIIQRKAIDGWQGVVNKWYAYFAQIYRTWW